MTESEATFDRRFGRWTLTLLVVANMIGAGVFTTSGHSLAALGSPNLVILAWFVGGVIALCGAFSYGQLVRHLPESGGEYVFLSRAIHPMAGYIAGWVSLIAGFTGAIAFAATAFESYLVPPEIRPEWLPADAIAILAVVTAGCAHGLAPRLGAATQNAAVLFKLGCLVSLCCLAILYVAGEPSGELTTSVTEQGGMNWSAFITSLVWISLSYSGFNAAVYVAEESINPRLMIPRSLLFATVLVTAIYLALNGLFLFATPSKLVAGRDDIAVATAEYLAGAGGRRIVQLVVCLALWTSLTSMLMAAPRVFSKMAEDGLFPPLLRAQRNRPLAATMSQIGLAIVFILVSQLNGLLGYLGLTLSLSAAATAACLFLPRFQQQPWQKLVTAVYVVTTLLLGVSFAWSRPQQFGAAVATFGFGAAMYWLTRFAQKKEPTLN